MSGVAAMRGGAALTVNILAQMMPKVNNVSNVSGVLMGFFQHVNIGPCCLAYAWWWFLLVLR
jgi:hypothetical protein